MMTKAAPLSGPIASKNSSSASSPPAEAPIATMGTGVRGLGETLVSVAEFVSDEVWWLPGLSAGLTFLALLTRARSVLRGICVVP